jgi:hypothetical protein
MPINPIMLVRIKTPSHSLVVISLFPPFLPFIYRSCLYIRAKAMPNSKKFKQNETPSNYRELQRKKKLDSKKYKEDNSPKVGIYSDLKSGTYVESVGIVRDKTQVIFTAHT